MSVRGSIEFLDERNQRAMDECQMILVKRTSTGTLAPFVATFTVPGSKNVDTKKKNPPPRTSRFVKHSECFSFVRSTRSRRLGITGTEKHLYTGRLDADEEGLNVMYLTLGGTTNGDRLSGKQARSRWLRG